MAKQQASNFALSFATVNAMSGIEAAKSSAF
jgi:hypothetical protein